ncbi:WYL domain-containing protein [Leucobacter coleopterorum]|uniref:WYL domain-containing protein n=1 Tax=Leucobacter coleopterorum TaxID=2714933 RepID=A0ABX6JVR4_9MICO|nr:WYL domain-containing protein [Leucobacter coleopterorum]QIM18396.1 WYL domain-containing protein [Leucobacter coleopterorum]
MSKTPERSTVPSEQRVFGLVLALVASTEGLTKSSLLSSVYGYSERYRRGGDNSTLERQFERDKELLRSLGIQIETLDSPLEPGNNLLTRYRISKELLQFPEDLRFTERELMLLRLAAVAWSEGSLSAESRRAAMKLESLGAGLDVQHLGIAPRLGTAEPAAAPLQRAIDTGVVAHFDYTMPGRDTPLMRRVAPLRLHRVDGRWHLIAWDLQRNADRVFLLSRISGEVRVGPEPFEPELHERADGIVADLLHRRETQLATVRVRAGSVAEARLSSRMTTSQGVVGAPQSGENVELVVGMLDAHVLAAELVGYGADVTVLSPPELRSLVVNRLRAVAAAHAEADHA